MKTVHTAASDILTDGELDHASGGWLAVAVAAFGLGFGAGVLASELTVELPEVVREFPR